LVGRPFFHCAVAVETNYLCFSPMRLRFSPTSLFIPSVPVFFFPVQPCPQPLLKTPLLVFPFPQIPPVRGPFIPNHPPNGRPFPSSPVYVFSGSLLGGSRFFFPPLPRLLSKLLHTRLGMVSVLANFNLSPPPLLLLVHPSFHLPLFGMLPHTTPPRTRDCLEVGGFLFPPLVFCGVCGAVKRGRPPILSPSLFRFFLVIWRYGCFSTFSF